MAALHSAIQVFYPSTMVSSDGLYSLRRYVYVGALVCPILMAGLAFVNPNYAYVSQGAFCTLPIRPFWYRLAFTWVPRYIIILMIIGLAVAIYAHVGFEFRAYSTMDQSLQSLKTSDGLNTPPQDKKQDNTKMEDITFELNTMEPRPQPQRRMSSIGHEIFTSQRQASSEPALSPSTTHKMHRVSFDNDEIKQYLPSSTLNLNRARSDSTRPTLVAIPSGCSIAVPVSPLDRTLRSAMKPERPEPTTTCSSTSSSSIRTPSPSSPDQIRLTKQRQRIHRQLRLMFIYPLVYTGMWALPFVMHCMNYWDKWAMQPVGFLRIGSSIAITLMGFADALIFSLREKPWRGIEGSDGTFWGSFACWRCKAEDVELDAEGVQISDSAAGRKRGSASYRTSASGEYARIAAEQARARLDLEREERLVALENKQGNRLKKEGAKGRHESLDVGDGGDGQVYDDNGLEDDTV